MLVFTHLAVGRFLHSKIHNNPSAGFRLNRLSFLAGNLYPDLSSMSRIGHYREETYDIYRESVLEAMDHGRSEEERSFSLGIACHFISDYFTKYHALQSYKSANIIAHLLYEVKLHFHVVYFMWRHLGAFEGAYESYSRFHLSDLLEAYRMEEEDPGTDCSYAMFALDMILHRVMGTAPIGLIGIPVEEETAEQMPSGAVA